MKISSAAQAIEPSLSRKLFNMAKNYDDVIDFTLGDPDLKPSEKIRRAACAAVMEGQTRYSANAGLIKAREVICDRFEKEYQMNIDPNSELILTVGGMEGLFLSLNCLIDDGDEVIVPAPYYVNYIQMIKMCGGVPVIVNTTEESGFCITAKQIENAITEKTVAIIINTPCNPTGEVIDMKTLEEIAHIAQKYDLTVISDEVYRTLIFDGKVHNSILSCPGMKDRTVVIDSLSKRFAMTGYRIGYAVGPQELIANMVKMQENVAACAPLPSQHAAIAAYLECADDNSLCEEFEKRRNYIFDSISKIKGLSCRKPAATFYLFVNIEQTGMNSIDFAYRLLESKHVAVVPGITYGQAFDHYIRIAFTLDVDVMKIGVERIQAFMNELK